jgi:hypothetical protein
MMHIKPENPIVAKIIKNILSKDLAILEFANDYDNCSYKIMREEGS